MDLSVSSETHRRLEAHRSSGGYASVEDVIVAGVESLERESESNEADVPKIVKTPGTCGGRARINGHRIRVMDVVVWHEKRGRSPDEILSNYPGLTLADVHAALAYYHANRDEIESDFQSDERLAKQGENNPSLLKGR